MDPETAAVGGIAPKKLVAVGNVVEVSGSGKEPYKLKRYVDHYSCTCPAWRFAKKDGPMARTCKHLKNLLGDAYELARVAAAEGSNGSATSAPSSSPSKRKGAPSTSSSPAKKARSTLEVMKAHTFDLLGGEDPTGYWMSEKLDGVRARWDGERMWSRTNKAYDLPATFREALGTDLHLDGELWMKRDAFDETSGIVRSGAAAGKRWDSIIYMVFDLIGDKSPVEARWEKLQARFGSPMTPTEAQARVGGRQVIVLAQEQCKSRAHMDQELKRVEALGGEGLMLRQAGSAYEHRRSRALLKVKSFYDAEAEVIGVEKGKGKNAGRMGALNCRMENGAKFKVGTGFKDSHRNHPPPIGTIINYKFQELSHDLTPRFPVFVGIAADKTKPKDAVVRSTKLRAASKAAAAASVSGQVKAAAEDSDVTSAEEE